MIGDKRREVREALDIWRRSPAFGLEQKEEAVRILANHGIWSKAHVRAITGATRRLVDKHMSKSDHSGGNFNPATLELIDEEFRLADMNETNPQLTSAIVRNGTGPIMLGRLLGISPSVVKYRAAKAVAK